MSSTIPAQAAGASSQLAESLPAIVPPDGPVERSVSQPLPTSQIDELPPAIVPPDGPVEGSVSQPLPTSQIDELPPAIAPPDGPVEGSVSQPLPTSQSPTFSNDLDTLHPSSADGQEATYKPSAATHADRNPGSNVQPVRTLVKISDAQKASKKLQQQIHQDEHQQLIEEFDLLLERHADEQAELAKKHGVKADYLDKLKGTSKHYKPKRAVNLENAKIHKKATEMNADRDLGDRLRMNDIRQLVKDDPDLQNLSEVQEAELRQELVASRDLKRLGARPSNRSAAQDYRAQLERLNHEINSLSERTGAAAVCFFTRTSLEDTYEPNWICSPNASNFTEDSLNRNMWDIARLFEQWACTKAKFRKPDTFSSLREQCSKLINGGLKTASKLDTAAMNYQNYDTQIVERLGVKLVGWTYDKMVSPYEIYTIDDIRLLHNALVCGSCFWMRLSKRQIHQHTEDMERREAAGEVVKKKRKERSDKGTAKGPRRKQGGQEAAEDGDEEEEPEARPSKKRKTKTKGKGKVATTKKATAAKKAKSQIPPSNEFIDDTDLEDFE